MNSCPGGLLPEYFRESLMPEEMENVGRHVAGCLECAAQLRIIASLSSVNTPVPEPPAAFWSSLPKKVTQERRSWPLWTVAKPVWAGGFAALLLVAALSLFLRTGAVRSPDGNLDPYRPSAGLSLGLEEELLSLSGSDGVFIDRFLEEGEEEFAVYGDQADDPMDLFFESRHLDNMPLETVEIFEKYIDEMIPNQMERG